MMGCFGNYLEAVLDRVTPLLKNRDVSKIQLCISVKRKRNYLRPYLDVVIFVSIHTYWDGLE
jgi:hypothetical protein